MIDVIAFLNSGTGLDMLDKTVGSAEETQTGRTVSFSASWSYGTDVPVQDFSVLF